MVRALGGRSTTRGETDYSARMRGEPPASGRRLVDGPAHERVPEHEPPRNVGRAHDLECEQLVQRGERRGLVLLRDLGGQIGLEWLARDGCSAKQRPRRVRQTRQLVGNRRRDRRRHRSSRTDGPVPGATARQAGSRGARQLLEIEGIPARLLVDGGPRRWIQRVQQLAGLGLGERRELEAADARRGDRGRQALRRLARPESHCE
jgi:hypothetical protein